MRIIALMLLSLATSANAQTRIVSMGTFASKLTGARIGVEARAGIVRLDAQHGAKMFSFDVDPNDIPGWVGTAQQDMAKPVKIEDSNERIETMGDPLFGLFDKKSWLGYQQRIEMKTRTVYVSLAEYKGGPVIVMVEMNAAGFAKFLDTVAAAGRRAAALQSP